MKYAITGATGKFGRQVIDQLLKDQVPANDIVALVRNPKKAAEKLPQGIEIRLGNYDNLTELKNALQGVAKLMLVSSQPGQKLPRLQQHKNIIDAAKAEHVPYIAYTSFPHASSSKESFVKDHKDTEQYIKDNGFKYSFLRNNWYLENDADKIKAAMQGKPIIYSAQDGKIGWAPEADYAHAAAKVLTTKSPKPIYEFAGPAMSYSDLAKLISEITNKPVTTTPVSDDNYHKQLTNQGLDDKTADLLTQFQALIRHGALTENTNDLNDVLQRDKTDLKQDLKKQFS